MNLNTISLPLVGKAKKKNLEPKFEKSMNVCQKWNQQVTLHQNYKRTHLEAYSIATHANFTKLI